MSRPRKTQRDRNKEATREAILIAARKLFGREGYSDTSLDAVVKRARVTTGAVYHHFGDKRRLFQAVAEDVELEVLKRAATATINAETPWQRLISGIHATLQICTEPEIRRIIFIDAPNVIGAAEWRKIELQFGYGVMRAGLAELQESGMIRAAPIDILAPMVLGALIEAANSIAASDDPEAARAAAGETISLFLESLRTRREI